MEPLEVLLKEEREAVERGLVPPPPDYVAESVDMIMRINADPELSKTPDFEPIDIGEGGVIGASRTFAMEQGLADYLRLIRSLGRLTMFNSIGAPNSIIENEVSILTKVGQAVEEGIAILAGKHEIPISRDVLFVYLSGLAGRIVGGELGDNYDHLADNENTQRFADIPARTAQDLYERVVQTA